MYYFILLLSTSDQGVFRPLVPAGRGCSLLYGSLIITMSFQLYFCILLFF